MSRMSKGQIVEFGNMENRGQFGEESGEDFDWLSANGGTNWRTYVPWIRANVSTVEGLLRPVPSTPAPTPRTADPFAVRDWRAEMKRFYRKVFGLKVDFSSVAIADDPGGLGLELFVPKGMTENRAWAKIKERFPARSDYGDDHDSMVPTNERVATESYGKRFRPRVEADEENKNLSANALAERGGENITLLERFLLELWYHWKTGQHLDIQCITLCAGSRDHSGYVPGTYWSDDKFQVWHYGPGYCYDCLRARSAV